MVAALGLRGMPQPYQNGVGQRSQNRSLYPYVYLYAHRYTYWYAYRVLTSVVEWGSVPRPVRAASVFPRQHGPRVVVGRGMALGNERARAARRSGGAATRHRASPRCRRLTELFGACHRGEALGIDTPPRCQARVPAGVARTTSASTRRAAGARRTIRRQSPPAKHSGGTTERASSRVRRAGSRYQSNPSPMWSRVARHVQSSDPAALLPVGVAGEALAQVCRGFDHHLGRDRGPHAART